MGTVKEIKLLRNRTFLSVWIGFLISKLGDSFFSIALGFIVLLETGSGLAMASILAAQMLGSVLIGPIAGTYVDRTDRRKLMIITDLIRAVLVFLLIIFLSFKILNIPLLMIVTFLISVAGTYFSDAYSSSIVNIVGKESVTNATSLLQLTSTITQIAGPALAGGVVATFGGTVALMTDSISYLVSALLVTLVKFNSPRLQNQIDKSFKSDLKDGFVWLINQPLVLGVTLLGPLLSLFGSAHTILILIISVKYWKVSGFEYGLIETAWPIGVAIASLLLLVTGKKLRWRGIIICVAFALSGLFYMIAPVMHNVYAALPFLIISGVFAGGGVTIMIIILRITVPPELQGRIFGLYGTLSGATWPIGVFLGGLLSDTLSSILLAMICGAGLLCAGLIGFFNREIRRYN
ncbi:hypothetical protein CN636_17140 [Bacillus toyonensis]|nr:hypothetical protein CN636_17140 [Bacillus toyonensis]